MKKTFSHYRDSLTRAIDDDDNGIVQRLLVMQRHSLDFFTIIACLSKKKKRIRKRRKKSGRAFSCLKLYVVYILYTYLKPEAIIPNASDLSTVRLSL